MRLSIAETARRSGFPASTLRYYEDLGLLHPPERTTAGYRTYDDDVLTRLAFIARAKELGCTLDEIAELLVAWEGERCEPVQARLRQLVAAKVSDAHRRIGELTAFTAQLQRAALALDDHTPAGACDDRCGCTTEVVLGTDPAIACTLEPGAMAQRVEDWQDLLDAVVRREEIESGIRVRFASGTSAAAVAALAEAEQRCCGFFAFAVVVDADGVALDVRAPEAARPVLESLFGTVATPC